MKRAAYLVVVLAAAVAALLPAGPALAEPSLLITGLQTQPGLVRFTIVPRGIAATTNLDPSQVTVTVGGTALPAEVRPTIEATGVPPRGLMLVVDATVRVTATELTTTRAAVTELLTRVPPDVRIGMVVMGVQPTVVAPTTDRQALTKVLAGASPAGNSTLLSGLLAADEALPAAGLTPDNDLRVLAFSDGRDLVTPLPETVRASLVAAAVPVDIVAIGANAASLSRLKVVTDTTGGRLNAVTDQAAAVASMTTTARAFPGILQVSATVPDGLGGVSGTLTVTIATAGLSASTPVTFSPSGSTGDAAPGLRLGWIPGWVAYIFGAMVFAALALVVLGLVWPRSQAYRRMKQIDLFGPARTTPNPRANGEPAGSVIARTALAATATVVRSGGLEAGIAVRLERAGMRMRPQEWVLVQVCITVGVAAVLGVLTDWIGFVVGLVLGWVATLLYLRFRVDRRANAFAEQLPDALQLVIGSLKSGFSLPQALDSLVRESPDPVAAEFGRALAEHRLGADVSDALERIAQRTGSEDLSWTVMAVRIQREVGGNLAEVLQTTVDTMRERGRLRRHVRALSAEGRLSAWVLIALPVVLGLFMFLYRREYMQVLFTDPLGVALIVCGGMLFAVGIIWMTRVIKVEA